MKKSLFVSLSILLAAACGSSNNMKVKIADPPALRCLLHSPMSEAIAAWMIASASASSR